MTSISLSVAGARAQASVNGPLTSGMVGIPVTIQYDEAWEGLTKNLVCRCGHEGLDRSEKRSILNVDTAATVAHEVMKPGVHLYLGVEGYAPEGNLVIPTTWADCGEIQRGANTGAELAADPTLPIWDQLQNQINQLQVGSLPQEQMDELRACAAAAAQSASDAATSEENAQNSAASAADRANEALQFQNAAEAAALRAEEAAGAFGSGLTEAQLQALDGMFRVAAYDADADYTGAYAAFCGAFGLSGSGGGNAGDGSGGENSGGESTGGETGGVSDETTWTDGVAYTFEPIANEYPDNSNGVVKPYNNWTRTPYLYCKGAAKIRVTVTVTTSALSGGEEDNAFYDEKKQYVSGFSYPGLASTAPGTYVDIAVPANAAYFILSGGTGRFPGTGGTTDATGCISLTPYG